MSSLSLTDLEQRNRLPTLFEVLSRRTLAPVDLFSFYIYMRDQQRSVDYLDFWYDLCALCSPDASLEKFSNLISI
jgi:hypothetical protein